MLFRWLYETGIELYYITDNLIGRMRKYAVSRILFYCRKWERTMKFS